MKIRRNHSIVGGALSVAFVGLVLFAQQGRAQEQRMGKMGQHTLMSKCAAACAECQLACDACANFCGQMLSEGKKEHLMTLTTCQDCATTCSASAQIVGRSGPFSKTICTACAEACTSCAAECQKFTGDVQMKLCAEECIKCAQACKDMLRDMESGK